MDLRNQAVFLFIGQGTTAMMVVTNELYLDIGDFFFFFEQRKGAMV